VAPCYCSRIMSFFGRAAALRTAAMVAALLPSLACGGDLTPARPSGPPAPPYTAHDAELFDDGIEARALGYDIAGTSGKDERLLPDRVDGSDGVVRARIVTVTSKMEDSGTALQLSLHTLETLAGRHAPPADFTLIASSRSPAAGLLKAAEGRLVGLAFIVFVRGFAAQGGEGDSVLHFHLADDDKSEQDRVRAATVSSFH
jgi:hypothetical protein